MQLLYSGVIFLSAALLFWVEPFFGKMVLPLLGGSPAVWNTCLVFFQTALLLGYLYAHLQTTVFGLRAQTAIHQALLGCAFFFLPIMIPPGWTPPSSANPVPWLMLVLVMALGLPFALLSATSPLLQSWFSKTGKTRATDPYFLYSASNAGSLVGLLAYPVVIEPYFTLEQQSWAWSAGYAMIFIAILAGAVLLWGRNPAKESRPIASSLSSVPASGLRLLLLAAVPSSLLQSVTSYLTLNLAAVPLLWVIPLSIYLISFILVFSRRQMISHRFMVLLQPVLLVCTIVAVWWWNQVSWWLFPLNLLILFVTSMVCHGELARLRPSPESLTRFYLWLATGGVVGGVFNAIVAPMIFNSLLEYPIALILAGFLLPHGDSNDRGYRSILRGLVLWIMFGIVLGAALWGSRTWLTIPSNSPQCLAIGVVAGLIIYGFKRRPVQFGLGLCMLFLVAQFLQANLNLSQVKTLYTERNFFGIVRVEVNRINDTIRLVHGTIIHGTQFPDPGRRREPTGYYWQGGPLGDFFKCLPPVAEGRKIAVAGLGIGGMTAYAASTDRWFFYEIDPAVDHLARDTEYFTYLHDCPAKIEVVVGDARLSLARAPDQFFNLIVLDAFSSDSIPVHLLTREALALYRAKLAPGGLILFNITNVYLDMGKVLHNLALDAGMPGLRRFVSSSSLTHREWAIGALPSDWVVLARNSQDLALLTNYQWHSIILQTPAGRPWTDDYSNLFACIKTGVPQN
ncbi:MAG: fused MFS/spermidine synthase [Desulfomonilaceae bacterium]